MLAASFKRTKIVSTIGPASNSPKILEELLLAGVNMFRLNFSHGTHEEHGAVIKVARHLSEKHNKPVAILADMQGPKIRVGTLPQDGLPFVKDTTVKFEYGANFEATGIIPVQYDISKYLKVGERIFLRDGYIQVQIDKIEKTLITATVTAAGLLYSNQGINLPDSDMGGDILTPKDIADIEFAVKSDADYIGLSFVQRPQDIISLKERIVALGGDQLVIAKIETAAAVENLEEIAAVTDAMMVARGDMAVETKPEMVPAVQRKMIELGKHHHIPVIVATQMLESMIQSAQPTRAEVSDVANAVMQGADAVMLSGETAMGLFPVDTVKMMKRIILYTEKSTLGANGNHEAYLANLTRRFGKHEQANAISASAAILAEHLPAKIIIAETSSGQTARNIAALRPSMPIVMVTDKRRTYFQTAIIWGGKSYLHARPTEATDHVADMLKEEGNVKEGDALVVTSGHQPGVTGGTDTVSIKIV